MAQIEKNIDFLADDDVATAIMKLIDEAEELLLCSPYNKYWGHLNTAIDKAIARGVDLTIIARFDQQASDATLMNAIHQAGGEVYWVDRLHAKIYWNEDRTILSSMNLHQSSALNSKGFAIELTGDKQQEPIVEYVRELIEFAVESWTQEDSD